MKIDKEQLVELLVEKTGMDQEEVEGQLNELIQRITDAAERGKALEIKGFGLFYFDDAGNLKFDPADEFSTEVNFKYAGMQPVELKPARESSEESDEDPDDEDDIFGIEDELIEEDQQKEQKEEPVDPIFGDAEDDEDEDGDDPFGSLLSGPASEFKEQDEKEIQKAGTAPKSSPKQKEESKKEEKKGKPAKKSPDQPAKKKSSPNKEKKDPMVTVIAVIIGVVVLVGAYFIYDEMSTTPAEPQTTQQPQVETEEPPVAVEPDVTESEPETPDEVQEPMAEEPEDVEPTADPAEPYGLEGDIVDSANDGFTIVLHSMRNVEAARSAAEQLRNAGYRSMVTERVVDGSTVFRVGVGQFPSIPDAQEAAEELPSPFNTENFIQRIRN